MVQIVEQLRAYDTDRGQPDDAIALLAFARLLRGEFEARQFAVPEWLDDRIRSLNRYLDSHRRDALELRLREARARQAALLTPDQKRQQVTDEIAQLERELGVTSNAPAPTT
jgi:hypothetical protein